MLSLLLAMALAIDPGQSGSPARHDTRGLLRIDAQAYEIAAATGGDFYFWARGEFAKSKLELPVQGEEVVLAHGRFEQPRRSVPIPVETGVRELTVFAGAQRKDRAVLVRPDGSIVADGATDARLQTFRHMLIATVANPAVGTWKLELDGAGLYSISAHVRPAAAPTAPVLGDFAYVELRGRPGHEGWFPIERTPRAGEAIDCLVRIQGFATEVQFATVTREGNPLGVLPLKERSDAGGEWSGRCVVPDRAFRVAVTGLDAQGVPFRRIEPALRTPEGATR